MRGVPAAGVEDADALRPDAAPQAHQRREGGGGSVTTMKKEREFESFRNDKWSKLINTFSGTQHPLLIT
jgi:hypothetical protein